MAPGKVDKDERQIHISFSHKFLAYFQGELIGFKGISGLLYLALRINLLCNFENSLKTIFFGCSVGWIRGGGQVSREGAYKINKKDSIFVLFRQLLEN